MASGRRVKGHDVRVLLLVALACAPAAPAFGASPACDVERAASGVGVGVQGGALTVAAVDAESPGARAGLRVGDVVLQANDVLPQSCAQWGRAVEAARDGRKALLLLVRRGGDELPLVLGARTWGAATVPPVAVASEPPAATERLAPAPPPPPPPLPPETPVSLDGVLRDLGELASPDDPPEDLAAYRGAVLHVRREIETLAERSAAPEPTITELRRVARYYEAAEIAWDAMEGDRARERRMRRLPVAEGATTPWFTDTPIAVILDEYDFLDATIARRPSARGLGVESSGLWRPAWARILLWERAQQALEDLRTRANTP